MRSPEVLARALWGGAGRRVERKYCIVFILVHERAVRGPEPVVKAEMKLWGRFERKKVDTASGCRKR